jgi:hypothetical protein
MGVLPKRQGVIDENRTVALGEFKYGEIIKERFTVSSPEEIDYITGDCSCTKAWLDGNEIVVEIDTNKLADVKNPTPHNKYVTIYYDKDEPYFIGDSKKTRVVNTKKRSSYINVSFTTRKEKNR